MLGSSKHEQEVDTYGSTGWSLNSERSMYGEGVGGGPEDGEHTEKHAHEYKLYGRRWLMLLMFSAVGLINNAMCIFFAPFPITASQYYHVSTFYIDFLSATFMIVTLLLTLPAAWICDTKGTRLCTIIGAIGTFLCGWVRWFSAFADQDSQYWVVLAGQLLGAIAQPF